MKGLIYDLTYHELEEELLKNGYKKYRAMQVWDWLYRKKVDSFLAMTNLSAELITYLTTNFSLKEFTLVKKQQATDGTYKLLYRLNDGQLIETVLMNHHYGLSLCVTTQVGCNMGCLFCASGQLKKLRDLTSGEIILQLIETEKNLNMKVNYIVVMGIGEPFDNFVNLTKFLMIANHPKGLAIGARHMTVSTCGLSNKIIEFAKLPLQVNLAISLHAANNELRSALMPINKRYPLENLSDAIKEYILATKRRVTIEYILIKDINDKIEDARQLITFLAGMNAYVNLIPYNEVKNTGLERSDLVTRNKFYDYLKKQHINVTLRKETGSNIEAACGQLRADSEDKIS